MNWQAIVQKNNLGATVISSSKLSFDMRLDAEYYQAQPLIEKIAKKNTKKLSKLSDWITQGPNPQFVEQGIPCLTGRNIAKGELVFDGADQVDEEEFAQLKRFKLQNQDVLITLKGAGSTGKVALFSSDTRAMFSRNLGLVRLSDGAIKPEYLFAFFSSILGQIVIDRGVTGGTGQLTLPTSYLKNLDIPIPTEKLIDAISLLVKKQAELQTGAKKSYLQAEQALLADLNLGDYIPSDTNTSTRKLSDCLADDRFDAEYWQPKYDEIIGKIKSFKNGYFHLQDIIGNYSTGYAYKSDTFSDVGIPLIRINNIQNGELDLSDAVCIPKSDLELSKKDIAKAGDILLSMSGTIGSACKVPENTIACVNQRIMRVAVKEYDAEALVAVLNSMVCKEQLNRIGTGGVQTNISSNDIKKIIIPRLPNDTQNRIGDLIKNSRQMKNEAKNLLEKAKRAVEIFVEQDETSALDYLSQL